ncbi:TPA: DNA sulfur modification protein DndE [Klebsiella oxytoca]|nr:DNA sulfur modification protein DndE [Klebsiella oxytoca]HDX8959194.1 DNA sulfur modification protein DndE [Klebsiella oxytoca]HDX9158977.1 DNA sulfur modification protein DndE [Klebsiella oxytoca]
MSIEHVRVSEKAKQQLITLKRRTGIENWNILCRWAFCISLAEKSVPPYEEINADSSIEMTWKVFAGENHRLYEALLRQRMYNDLQECDENNLNYYFRLHLHRGISYLVNRVQSIDDLISEL